MMIWLNIELDLAKLCNLICIKKTVELWNCSVIKHRLRCLYLWCRRRGSGICVLDIIPCLDTMLTLYILKLLQPCSKVDSLVRTVDIIVFCITVLVMMHHILRERNSWKCSAYLVSTATEWVRWDSFQPRLKYPKRPTLLNTKEKTKPGTIKYHRFCYKQNNFCSILLFSFTCGSNIRRP